MSLKIGKDGEALRIPALQVSPRLWRSPQPDFEDFLALRTRGVRAIVNLREEATESAFFSRQSGLDYLHIPVRDWQIPTLEQVEEFISFVETKGPALVHCAAGVGRTGTFVACYRMFMGMSPDVALNLTNSETPLPGVFMNRQQHEFVNQFSSSVQRLLRGKD